MRTIYLLLACFGALAMCLGVSAAPTAQDFSGKGRQTPYTLSAFGAQPGPQVQAGALRLLDKQNGLSNTAAFARTAKGLYRSIEARWDLSIGEGGNGASFALLNTQEYGTEGAAPAGVDWVAPKLRHSFALAFDIYDPPTDNPFNAMRNIYNRPQREVALFWDGIEVARRLSPVEFRTGEPVPVRTLLEAVCGGTEVSVYVAGTPVFERYFIAGMLPYESRAAFGGQTGTVSTRADIANVRIDYRDAMKAPEPAVIVHAIDGQVIDVHANSRQATAAFPDNTDRFGRIICTLTLAEPPGGYDPWDRSAAVYLYDDKGERYELLRFITPYRRGYTWNVDVSDFRPLLSGSRKVEAWCVTWATGWKVSVDFAFYPGRADRYAYRIENLWCGQPEIGNPAKPVQDFYTPQTITADPKADFVKLRMTVTGHGQAPNSKNAAEFLPLKRTLFVNDHAFENLLWKSDNYLNPCRPQGGTWKYDRAGWAPGDVVTPWELDLTQLVSRGKPFTLRYELAPYTNESADRGNPPIHWTETQVVYYRRGK